MSPRMTHICLHVKTLDDCVRFYKDYCDMRVIHKNVDGGEGSVYMSEVGRQTDIVFQLKSGGDSLTLSDNEERHFGFAVESKHAVDDIADKARKENILFFEPDEYLLGAYLCGVKDPNGNCIEFGYNHPVPPV